MRSDTDFGGAREKNKFLLTEEMLLEDAGGGEKQATTLLERFRRRKVRTANFRGAQCLLNIKNKQILSRKTTSNLMRLASVATTPQPDKTELAGITVSINGGVGSNCSSLSSSVSPSSASSTASSSSSRLKPRKLQKYNSYSHPVNNAVGEPKTQSYLLTYSDLNERLFSCLLSNFSCKLVENFLRTNACLKAKESNSESGMAPESLLLSTGFIRKQKFDKSFSFVNVANEPLNAVAGEYNISPAQKKSNYATNLN